MDEEGSLTRSAIDTYIEEPKVCGHKIKTKICAFLLTGIFCVVAGAIMMIVGIVGHEGHLVGILGTLIVVLGVVALSLSLSMFCCRKKKKKNQKKNNKYHSKPIVRRPIQKNEFKKLNEQDEPMMTATTVNEAADSKSAANDDANEEDDIHDVIDTREDKPLTSAATGKKSSSADLTEGKRTSKTSTNSLSQTEIV